MITINLRPGVKHAAAGSGVSPLTRLRGLFSGMKDPLPLLAVLAWVGAVAFLGWTYVNTSLELSALQPDLEAARSEAHRYRDFLGAKRRAVLTRDSLLTQIETIQAVDGDRYVWPHILDEVGRALPSYTWLTDLSVTQTPSSDTTGTAPIQFDVTGRTVDIQGYTRFLRQLEDSPWLGSVAALSAKTVVDANRAVTEFIVRATFTPADSAFRRSVPVSQSVVR